MISFEKFSATRLDSNDIGKDIGMPEIFVSADGETIKVPGYVYGNRGYIQAMPNGQYCVDIENVGLVGTLEALERVLYAWYCDECGTGENP